MEETTATVTIDGRTFDTDARYTVRGYEGIAFWIDGPEVESYWDLSEGIDYDEPEERATGMLLVVMVGDDRRHVIDPDDLTELHDGDYCPECGQVGCTAYPWG